MNNEAEQTFETIAYKLSKGNKGLMQARWMLKQLKPEALIGFCIWLTKYRRLDARLTLIRLRSLLMDSKGEYDDEQLRNTAKQRLDKA